MFINHAQVVTDLMWQTLAHAILYFFLLTVGLVEQHEETRERIRQTKR